MNVPLEKPGTPEELVHFGVKGMKWGVRNAKSTSSSGSTEKKSMSTKKKVAIGVGVGAAVVGVAATAYILGGRGKIRISDIDGGKDNLIRLKNGKGAISTLSHEQWNRKISNSKASYRMQEAAAKSIAARRKAGRPGYRPGEILGLPLSNTNNGYPRALSERNIRELHLTGKDRDILGPKVKRRK